MAFPKKQILQKIEEKIVQYQNDIDAYLNKKTNEDQTPRFFVFLKKLFRIQHSPKYLTREEAYHSLLNPDTFTTKSVSEMIEFQELKDNLDYLFRMKQRLMAGPDDPIELFTPEKKLLESRWRW